MRSLFIVSVTLIVWQGSFSGNFGSFAPDDPDQTFVIYGVSTIISLVFVYLGFMLVRLIWKIWIERASDRPGSRIKTKLVAGALMLSVMPVFFMVFFSVYVLSNSMGKWFNLPAEHERVDLDRIAKALDRQTRDKANAEAELLAATPETRAAACRGTPIADPEWLARFCRTARDRGGQHQPVRDVEETDCRVWQISRAGAIGDHCSGAGANQGWSVWQWPSRSTWRNR